MIPLKLHRATLESRRLQIAAGSIRKTFQEEIYLNSDEIHKYIVEMKNVWKN